MVEDLHVARTVHRLERQHLVRLVLHGRDEHVLPVLVPVPGLLPQHPVHELRRAHLVVARLVQPAAHVALGRAIQPPSLGVPEDAAHRLFLDVEQVHGPADPAVVALFRLLQLVEVRFQFLPVTPRRGVDAAQHRVAVVAPPVGARHPHQLERRAHVSRAPHVRAAAQVDPVALAVERDRLAFGQIADQLGLVALAPALEEADRLLAAPHLAREGRVAGDDLAHLAFDGREVRGRERLVAGEVVVEPVLDRRPDRHLRARVKLLHRFRQHVGGVVPDHGQRIRVAARDEHHRGVMVQRAGQVLQRAVHLHGQGGAGEARADARRQLGPGDGRVEPAHGTVRERDGGHGSLSQLRVKDALMGVRHRGRNPFGGQIGQDGRAEHGHVAPGGCQRRVACGACLL